MYIYLVKCVEKNKENEKAAVKKKNKFRRTRGMFNFQAKYQYQFSKSPNLFPTATAK
jgi:hypothetical protein